MIITNSYFNFYNPAGYINNFMTDHNEVVNDYLYLIYLISYLYVYMLKRFIINIYEGKYQ